MKEKVSKTKKLPAPKSKKGVLSVSPSAWMVWEKCALSLQNVKSPFVLERDEYAKEGTLLHAQIAEALKVASCVIDKDGDDAEIIRFAVETVRNELSESSEYDIEAMLQISTSGISFSGFADVVAVQGDMVIVPDFKTGWREVEAENNSQLKIYAHVFAANRPDLRIKRWKGIIINARFNSVSYTGGDIEPDYLLRTAKDILDRTAKKQLKVGNHCAYCNCLSTCTHVRKAIAAWCKPGAIDSITREPEKLAEALRLAKPAEKLFETIKKEAQLFIDLGGKIPNVSVEYTAGTRAWPKDLSIDEIAVKLNMVGKMVEPSIISPAQAEKKGADKNAVNAIAIRPPRKGFKFI